MAFDDLQTRLRPLEAGQPQALVIDTGLTGSDSISMLMQATLGAGAVTIQEARVSFAVDRIVVSGKALCLTVEPVPVEVVFEAASPHVKFRLTATLPGTWTFGQSFPNLPPNFNFDPDNYGYGESYLLSLTFSEPVFVLTTHDWEDPASRVRCKPGLNFQGHMDLSGPFQGLEILTGSRAPILISGLIASTAKNPEFRLSAQLPLRLGESSLTKKFRNVRLSLCNSLSAANSAAARIEVGVDLEIFAGKTVELYYPIRIGAPFEFAVIGGRFAGFDLPDLGQIAELVGGSDLREKLPDKLQAIGGLTVEEVRTGISLRRPEISYILVSVRTTSAWPVVDAILEIDSLVATWLIESPFRSGERRVGCEVEGRLRIADVFLDINAQFPDFRVRAGLAEGSTIKFGALLKHFIPGIPLPDDSLIISRLALAAEPGSKAYRIDARVDNIWSISLGSAKLAMASLSLSLASSRGQLSGSVEGVLELRLPVDGAERKLRLTLGAALPDSSAGGWLFNAHTGLGEKIPVGALIRQFAGANANIPPAVESLTFQNVAMSFNTANQDFSFRGTAELKLEEKQFVASLAVNFKRTGWDASGTLTVGGAEFQFSVNGNDTGQNLTAVWTDDNGRNQPPDLLVIGNLDLQDLRALLIPKKATLTVNLTKGGKSLALALVQQNGTEAAFLLAQVPDKDKQPVWVAALGVKPRRVSTTSLGVIGTALQPYDIALDKLVVLAATGDGAENTKLVLGDGQYSVSKGLFLKGALEFANTSFSAPFECRVGGAGGVTVATTGNSGGSIRGPAGSGAAANTGPAPEKGKREEAKNNVPVGKTIGPVTFRKARFESRDNRVYLKLDASLGSGGFALDLEGFNVNFPLKLLQDPIKNAGEISVGLDGLSIAYSKPPLTIAGGFAKTADVSKPYVGDLYRGFLVVEAAKFQITVVGSYGNIEVNGKKEPSLFMYGAYAGVVGGPAEFFVTGLALGGGYNTRLRIPPIEKVADFPLIQAVTDPGKFTVSSLGEAVREKIGPSPGDCWLAVGVKFTSYKIVDSFALFSVAFGNRLQFALLGLTKLALPPEAGKNACAVYAELAIRAVLDPEAGVFCIEGQLTQNSFVLTKELHLTGGFAFFVWFGNAKEAGDFVISLGGYHKDFRRPAHYPLVPRIGLNGAIGPLTVMGEAYLALTPSCLMAGLKLEAVFASGIITAAFVAYADFLMEWAPFRYDARIGIGIAVTINLLRTYRLEVSATLHIWGPPFAGTAVVTVFIFSFTIEFGDHSQKPAPRLNWEEFQKAFLPAATPGIAGSSVATVRVAEGLVREVEAGPQKENQRVVYQIVNPHELVIETDSVIPCTEVRSGAAVRTAGTPLGIRPMGAAELKSQHVVTIADKDGKAVDSYFVPVRYARKNFPEALWSPAPASVGPGAKPADPKMVEGALAGIALKVKPTLPAHKLGPFPIAAFAYFPIGKDIPWAKAKPVPSPAPGSFQAISEENARRIRDRLPERSSGWNQITMKNISADLGGRFQAPFLCAALGQSLAAAMTGNQ